MSYKFIPEEQEILYPPRLKEIIDEYERHGFTYRPDELQDMEAWKEIGFERKARKHPETVRTEVLSIHRIRDEFNNKEYLLYKIKKTAEDAEPIELWMGKKPRFDTANVLDDDGNVVNKRITKWNMVYTIEWTVKAFDEVIRSSSKKKIDMYIADASEEYHTNWTGQNIKIKDVKSYREMTHEELIILDENLKVANQARQLRLSNK